MILSIKEIVTTITQITYGTGVTGSVSERMCIATNKKVVKIVGGKRGAFELPFFLASNLLVG